MAKGGEWYSKRSSAIIPIASAHIIICCGAETEKNYFESIVGYIKSQEKNKLLKFYVEVDAVDPMNMANNVSEITENVAKKENCKIQHVWVLFDKDDFKPDNFNNAIAKIKCLTNSTTTYHALWSNQCFELWLLLNFINMQSAINREAYIEKLEVYLKEKYKKNDENLFGKITLKGGNIIKAISYAKGLIDNNLPPAKNDPATMVYEFFEHFSNYLGLWQ